MSAYLTTEQANKVLFAMELGTKELLSIHDQLDALEVPRLVEGEKLSASQRVTVLIGAYKSACTRVAKGGE